MGFVMVWERWERAIQQQQEEAEPQRPTASGRAGGRRGCAPGMCPVTCAQRGSAQQPLSSAVPGARASSGVSAGGMTVPAIR